MKLKVYLLPLTFSCFWVNNGICQTKLFPFIGGNYTSIDWSQDYLDSLVDTLYSGRMIFGLGLEHSANEKYSLLFRNSIYQGSSKVRSGGINPILHTEFRIWDSDISLSRAFGKALYLGAGFKHQLFHRFRITSLVEGEGKGKLNIGALGYSLHMRYEVSSFGAIIAYSNTYNYDTDGLFITFSTSNIFELVGYYKFSIANRTMHRED